MLELKDLPVKYIDDMKELLGEEFDEYVESLGKRHVSGLRVNNLKISNEELLKLLGKDMKKVPWIENVYYTNEDDRLSKSPLYHAGLYYLQEPSAMTTASLSGVRPGDKVLDLCAAPGGKSTLLRSILPEGSHIVANEPSAPRAMILMENLIKWGPPGRLRERQRPHGRNHLRRPGGLAGHQGLRDPDGRRETGGGRQ